MDTEAAASTKAAGTAVGKPPAGLRRLRGNPPLTVVAVAVGAMMVGLDGTIVAVANPAIQSHLHTSLAGIQWVSNAYLLALAVCFITIGKVGDRLGHKKVFMVGVAGFALSSAAIGLSGSIAGSIGLVITFRVLQGLFGAMLQPSALALLRETFPPEKLSAAIGVWGGVIGASTAAGPVVGGLLVQHVGWESCFYVNVPVAAVALVMCLFAVRETPPSPEASSFDIPGIVTLSGALFLLLWGLIKASSYGWASWQTFVFLGGAVVLGLLFVLRQSRASQPLLPLRLFRSVSLCAGTALVVLLMIAFVGALFFITFYLENVHGLDPVGAGLRLLPMTAMLIVGAPLGGALITKIGPRIPIAVGMLLAGVAMYGLSGLGATSSPNETLVWFPLLGLGLSPALVGATDVIVGNAPVELAGVAGGLQSTAMQVGGTLGNAILGALVSARVSSLLLTNWHAAHLPPMTAAQLAGAKAAVSVGVAPVSPGIPAQMIGAITSVSHATFTSGMHIAFLFGAGVAVVGASIALLTDRGTGGTQARPAA